MFQVWTLGEHDFLDWGETKIPTIRQADSFNETKREKIYFLFKIPFLFANTCLLRSKVEKVIVSPEWNSMTTRGDIALIKVILYPV